MWRKFPFQPQTTRATSVSVANETSTSSSCIVGSRVELTRISRLLSVHVTSILTRSRGRSTGVMADRKNGSATTISGRRTGQSFTATIRRLQRRLKPMTVPDAVLKTWNSARRRVPDGTSNAGSTAAPRIHVAPARRLPARAARRDRGPRRGAAGRPHPTAGHKMCAGRCPPSRSVNNDAADVAADTCFDSVARDSKRDIDQPTAVRRDAVTLAADRLDGRFCDPSIHPGGPQSGIHGSLSAP